MPRLQSRSPARKARSPVRDSRPRRSRSPRRRSRSLQRRLSRPSDRRRISTSRRGPRSPPVRSGGGGNGRNASRGGRGAGGIRKRNRKRRNRGNRRNRGQRGPNGGSGAVPQTGGNSVPLGSMRMRMDDYNSMHAPQGNGRMLSDPRRRRAESREKDMNQAVVKARREASTRTKNTYWTKKLLDAEVAQPSRWAHSGFKELYGQELGYSDQEGKEGHSPRENKKADGGDRRRIGRISLERSRGTLARKGNTGGDAGKRKRRSSSPVRGRPSQRSPKLAKQPSRKSSHSRSSHSGSYSSSYSRSSSRSSRSGSYSSYTSYSRSSSYTSTSSFTSSVSSLGSPRRGAPLMAKKPRLANTATLAKKIPKTEPIINKNRAILGPAKRVQTVAKEIANAKSEKASSNCATAVSKALNKVPTAASTHVVTSSQTAKGKFHKSKGLESRDPVTGSIHKAAIRPPMSPSPSTAPKHQYHEKELPIIVADFHHHGAVTPPLASSSAVIPQRIAIEGRRGPDSHRYQSVVGETPEYHVKRTKTKRDRHSPIEAPQVVDSGSESSGPEEEWSAQRPRRATLSERFGKLAQLSSQRQEYDGVRMKIVREGGQDKRVYLESGRGEASSPFPTPPSPSHHSSHAAGLPLEHPAHEHWLKEHQAEYLEYRERYGEVRTWDPHRDLPSQLPLNWDDVRVRYRHYKESGYFGERLVTLDDYLKWEEWWYQYRDWLSKYGDPDDELTGPERDWKYRDYDYDSRRGGRSPSDVSSSGRGGSKMWHRF